MSDPTVIMMRRELNAHEYRWDLRSYSSSMPMNLAVMVLFWSSVKVVMAKPSSILRIV
jgi:hypothetical protein